MHGFASAVERVSTNTVAVKSLVDLDRRLLHSDLTGSAAADLLAARQAASVFPDIGAQDRFGP